MSKKPKIAIVGAGLIGCKHAEVVSRFARIDAIIDPASTTQKIARKYSAAWHSELDSYLESNHPDGVIIASPNKLHLSHGIACLKAGIPVLIEKPLADTQAAAHELASLSKESGTPILVGHHRRYSNTTEAVKSCIESGNLGRIVTVNAMFWLNKPDDYFNASWRSKKGGGPTYINLIHDIDLLQHFCGTISYVQANEGHQIRKFEVEDTSAVILEFETGVLGTVSICDTTSAPWSWELTSGENPVYPNTGQNCYMIGGTKGALSVPDLRLWTHTGSQSWLSPMKSDKIKTHINDPIIGQFKHFLDVIQNGAEPNVSASDGVRNLEVLDAIKNAAVHGGIQVVSSEANSIESFEAIVPASA